MSCQPQNKSIGIRSKLKMRIVIKIHSYIFLLIQSHLYANSLTIISIITAARQAVFLPGQHPVFLATSFASFLHRKPYILTAPSHGKLCGHIFSLSTFLDGTKLLKYVEEFAHSRKLVSCLCPFPHTVWRKRRQKIHKAVCH